MPTKPGHYRGERPFDLIITLYADAQPAPWGVEEIRYGFPDSDLCRHDQARIERIAIRVAEAWSAGERVLVRCQAGVNRSGLVVAMVLRRLGWSAEEALSRVRMLRSDHVLSNRQFRLALGLPS